MIFRAHKLGPVKNIEGVEWEKLKSATGPNPRMVGGGYWLGFHNLYICVGKEGFQCFTI